MPELLKHPGLNGWRLFWLITVPVSAAMLIAMARTDLATGAGVSAMIQRSVRCAVPLLYLAFAASSLAALFPGAATRWLLRNRKFIGLSFAAAMAWQALFILWLVTVHRDYYLAEVYVLRDVIEGVLGYGFLIAMTVTSFEFGRRRLTPRQWKALHKVGIYTLWIYAFSVYWWELFYYPGPEPIDYLYYWAGFGAWALRAAAWGRKRRTRRERDAATARQAPALSGLGLALVVLGVIVAATGNAWRPVADDLLYGHAATRALELYLPYWPFEPYYSVFLVLAGVALISATARPSPR